MEGLFVDSRSCLCIISQTDSPALWRVECAEPTETDGFDATIRTVSGGASIRLETPFQAAVGKFDGENSIVWEDGTSWTRLRVSLMQFHTLTRRPYISFTLLLMGMSYALLKQAALRVRSAVWRRE